MFFKVSGFFQGFNVLGVMFFLVCFFLVGEGSFGGGSWFFFLVKRFRFLVRFFSVFFCERVSVFLM